MCAYRKLLVNQDNNLSTMTEWTHIKLLLSFPFLSSSAFSTRYAHCTLSFYLPEWKWFTLTVLSLQRFDIINVQVLIANLLKMADKIKQIFLIFSLEVCHIMKKYTVSFWMLKSMSNPFQKTEK